MSRSTVFSLGLALILPLVALADEGDAKARAQAILDKGSALFDKKDAGVMAATYTEDAQVLWISKENDSSEVSLDPKKGRTEIEALYRDTFNGSPEKSTSKNVVESATLIAPEVMIVQGTFQPDISKAGKYPFVQVRVKQGDKWLIKSLQFFVFSQD